MVMANRETGRVLRVCPAPNTGLGVPKMSRYAVREMGENAETVDFAPTFHAGMEKAWNLLHDGGN